MYNWYTQFIILDKFNRVDYNFNYLFWAPMTVIKSENGWYNHSFFFTERDKQGEIVRKKTLLFDVKKEDSAFC